jgi:nucleotidyltransferase substrate binding protein (TIGR01987 family)
MENKLDLTSLTKAIASFHKALDEYTKDESNEFVRDSCIQRFEYCYDLTTKFLKRHLSIIAENPGDIKTLSFQEIIREAYTKEILKNSWDKWWEYRDNRNATSLAYSIEKAVEVIEKLPEFLSEITFFHQHLSNIYEAKV